MSDWLADPMEVTIDTGGAQRGPMNDEALFQQCDHALFVGAPSCAYHNMGGWAGGESCSILCPSDAQMATCSMDELVLEAVEEIEELRGEPLESLLLSTACQAAFMGVDFKGIAERLARHGVVCLRRENCRIFANGPGMSGSPSGISSAESPCEQLADLLLSDSAREGQGKAISSGGILVVTSDIPFAWDNELRAFGEGQPFTWVEGLGDELSMEQIDRLSRSQMVLGLGSECAALAERAAERIGATSCVLPDSYLLSDIDEAYASLEEQTGESLDTAAYRDEALAAIDAALAACEGRELSLRLEGKGRMWNLVGALISYGFSISRILVELPFTPGNCPPPRSWESDPDYLALAEAHPEVAGLVYDAHLMESPGGGGRPPEEGGFVTGYEGVAWGYRAIIRAMEQLSDAVGDAAGQDSWLGYGYDYGYGYGGGAL